MSAPRGKKVTELLISKAWSANLDSRYSQSLATAERAERAAEGLRDPGLVVRALYQQEWALRVLGDMRVSEGAHDLAGRTAMSPRPYRLGKREEVVGQGRRRILDAARELLRVAAAYPGFTVDAVARRADVARGSRPRMTRMWSCRCQLGRI
jgi:hypothetical protein